MSWINLEDRSERVLGKILRRQADKIPDQIYIMSGEEKYSYGRVNELANSYAAGLHGLGIGSGDTVAVLMENCPEFVFTTFGANKLGGIWVPTNIEYKGEWLRQALEDSRASVLVADAELLPRVAELGPGLPFEKIIVRGTSDGVVLGIPLIDISEFSDLSPKW